MKKLIIFLILFLIIFLNFEEYDAITLNDNINLNNKYKVYVKYLQSEEHIFFMECCIIYLILFPEIICYFPSDISKILINYYEQNYEQVKKLKSIFNTFLIEKNYDKLINQNILIEDNFQRYYDFYSILEFFSYLLIETKIFDDPELKKSDEIIFNFCPSDASEYFKNIYMMTNQIFNFNLYLKNNQINIIDFNALMDEIIQIEYNDLEIIKFNKNIEYYYKKYCEIFNLFSNYRYFDQQKEVKNVYYEFNLNFWKIKTDNETGKKNNSGKFYFPLKKYSIDELVFILGHELTHWNQFDKGLISDFNNTGNDYLYNFFSDKIIIPKNKHYLINYIKSYCEDNTLQKINFNQMDLNKFDYNELIADLAANLFYYSIFNKISDYRSHYYLLFFYEKEFFNYFPNYYLTPSTFFSSFKDIKEKIKDFSHYFFNNYLYYRSKYYYIFVFD